MKIKIVPTGEELEASTTKSVMQICHEHKIPIASICKGVPNCAECRVRVIDGEHNVPPPNQAELNLIGSAYYLDGRRLSCQLRCFGDITIDVSEQIERSKNQKRKTRGFHRPGAVQMASKAVQGTLILEEGKLEKEPDEKDAKQNNRGPQRK